MSKSRLEKFLYALYSLDSSDLPTPLSRIEELYKCWVTGEKVPFFKPLSRVEKYLMAILGVYDVDSLPNPLSRVEVLLYKLATGDDNLDDVETFLSEHEELLAEIIRNRGAGGNINIEYVLYTLSTEHSTLYNTAEKPVKSAILKGNTLVNLSENLNTIKKSLNSWYSEEMLIDNIEKLKRNTYYTVLYRLENLSGNHENYNRSEIGIGTTSMEKALPSLNAQYNINKNGDWCKIKFQLTDDYIEENPTYNKLYIRPIRRFTSPVEGESVNYTIRGFAILEGDYITNPIPFNEVFEGMQSVKMPVVKTTGKNLCDTSKYIHGGISADNIIFNDKYRSYYMKCKPSTTYTIRVENSNNRFGVGSSHLFSENTSFPLNKSYIMLGSDHTGKTLQYTLTTTEKDSYLYVYTANNGVFNPDIKVQLEEGSIATSYEPYKSNILSTPSDLELRGIGDVKDELNLITGEYTKAIYKYTFTGDEGWVIKGGVNGGYTYFACSTIWLPNQYNYKSDVNIPISCDKLPIITYGDLDNRLINVGINLSYEFRLNFSDCDSNNGATVEDLKAYLKANPTTVHYPISKSIKTVDLSVVDQDGNNAELSTFNDITHVTLSSEGLIPEAELEVAMKNKEVLSTLSLEMNDISTTQNALQETSNTQSENVDATMIATTEIYEELL